MIWKVPKAQPAPANLELLTLFVRCPECGHGPNFRVTHAERSRALRESPETLCATYKCHRPSCRTVYTVTKRAYQRAYRANKEAA